MTPDPGLGFQCGTEKLVLVKLRVDREAEDVVPAVNLKQRSMLIFCTGRIMKMWMAEAMMILVILEQTTLLQVPAAHALMPEYQMRSQLSRKRDQETKPPIRCLSGNRHETMIFVALISALLVACKSQREFIACSCCSR